MKKLTLLSVLSFGVGAVFIFYGWTQTWGFGAKSYEVERILMERTVRSYSFMIGGVILMFVGFALEIVKDAISEVVEKMQ